MYTQWHWKMGGGRQLDRCNAPAQKQMRARAQRELAMAIPGSWRAMFLQEVLAFPEWKESVLVAEAEAIAAQDSKVSEADGASSHVQGAEASSGTIELVPAHTRVKCDEGEEVSDSIDASSGEAVPVEAGLVPDGIAHATAPATVQATRRRGVMSATSALPASAAAHANTIAPQEERLTGTKTRRRRPEGRRAEGRDGPKDQVNSNPHPNPHPNPNPNPTPTLTPPLPRYMRSLQSWTRRPDASGRPNAWSS